MKIRHVSDMTPADKEVLKVHMARGETLVISNVDVGDTTFMSSEGSWNISRALRDCAKGKHKLGIFRVADCLAPNAKIEVDEAKVQAMVANGMNDAPPLIIAFENGKAWLIDGHHRLRAYAILGDEEFVAWVIEEDDARPYQIFYNGQRIPPWQKAKH